MNLRITDLLDEYDAQRVPMDGAAVPNTVRIKEAIMKKLHKRPVRPLRIALIAAIIVLLLAGSALAVRYYTKSADTLKENWNSFSSTEMTEEQKDYVDEKSADVVMTATDQGITVTVESVACTADTVYLTYTITPDPEQYDVESIYACSDVGTLIYAENATFGTQNYSGNAGSGNYEDGICARTSEVKFNSLADGWSLNDGDTTLYIEMAEMALYSGTGIDTQTEDVEGSWNFSFVLPSSETSAAKASDVVLTFSDGISMTVTDISVTESACQFAVETDSNTYAFPTSDMAELYRAAEPETTTLTVDALLENGSTVPSNSSSMSHDNETGMDVWSIYWSAPIDPSTVVALIFSDGTTEYEIPLDG